MKKLPLLAFCLALGCGLAARAADDAAVPSASLPEVDHMVYLTFLPEPEDLMADVKTNGLTILRLDKTADRVVVTYKYPDGNVATLGYALLGAARNTDRVRERPVKVVERRTTVVERDPEVIYVERPYTRVVYRERDDFWLPLTIGLGIGYVTGHHGGHHSYHRGHAHWRWRH